MNSSEITDKSTFEEKSPKRWVPVIITIVFFIVIISGITAWRARQNQDVLTEEVATEGTEINDQIVKFDKESVQLAGIELGTAELQSLATSVSFNGEIAAAPDAKAKVSSVVSGRITRIHVSAGDKVKAGQTLAAIESQNISEAQAAYTQAAARLKNATSNLAVVQKQVKAGVFSRDPLEAARKSDVEANANLQNAEAALRQARVAADNTKRQAEAGAFANPALEAAKDVHSSAQNALSAAKAEVDRSKDQLNAANAELQRRQRLAAAGSYNQKPVEDARRTFVSAQSELNAARSENSTAQQNVRRAKVLLSEGLISQREADTIQTALERSRSRMNAAQADVAAAQQEWDRQKNIAKHDVMGTAEVNAAQAQVADAEASIKTRSAELQRATDALRLANIALKREQTLAQQNIANRREISSTDGAVEQAKVAVTKARQEKVLSSAALAREERIAKERLNNTAQLQAAQAEQRSAQADFKAAQTSLQLLKSSPNGKASIPITAPVAGTITNRAATLGEVIGAEQELFTVTNLAFVAIDAAIYEKDIAKIKDGAAVTVTVDSLPKQVFAGSISFIDTQLDPETRTLTARALLPNDEEFLRPGMFARGQIATEGNAVEVIGVPSDAVQKVDDKTVVFVPSDKSYEYAMREVTTGATANGITEIKDGLQDGEKIVVKGAFIVKSQAMKDELAED